MKQVACKTSSIFLRIDIGISLWYVTKSDELISVDTKCYFASIYQTKVLYTDLWLNDTTKWPACKSGPAFLGIFFIDIYVIIVFIIQNLSPHMISGRTTSRLLIEVSDKYLRIIFYQPLAPLLHCVYAALCHWLNTYHHRSLHKGAVGGIRSYKERQHAQLR